MVFIAVICYWPGEKQKPTQLWSVGTYVIPPSCCFPHSHPWATTNLLSVTIHSSHALKLYSLMRSHCMVFLSGFFNSAYLFGITQIRLLQHVSIVRPFSWHSSRPLYGYTVFVYQFTCWWTFRLFPCWGCCERTF